MKPPSWYLGKPEEGKLKTWEKTEKRKNMASVPFGLVWGGCNALLCLHGLADNRPEEFSMDYTDFSLVSHVCVKRPSE